MLGKNWLRFFVGGVIMEGEEIGGVFMAAGTREELIERVQKMSEHELDKVIFYVASLERGGGEPTLYVSSEEKEKNCME